VTKSGGQRRILLDNCLPANPAPHIRGHQAVTAIDMGWAALSDSEMLAANDGKFDVLLTAHTNIRATSRCNSPRLASLR
jgi:hypothetical protein